MALLNEQIRLYAEYNRWMNRNLYAAAATLSDAERRMDRGAYFRSVHGTLNHLYYGEQAWLGRFRGGPFVPDIGHEFFSAFGDLRAAHDALDDELIAWSKQLNEAWLESAFTFTSAADGRTRTFPAWVLVTHLFNHQTHHRGQLTALFSQLGIDYGVTDIPRLPGLEAWGSAGAPQ